MSLRAHTCERHRDGTTSITPHDSDVLESASYLALLRDTVSHFLYGVDRRSLTMSELFALARQAIDAAFCPEGTKTTLRENFDEVQRNLVIEYGL